MKQDLGSLSFEELDAYKTELYREEQALRERKLAVEAAMQAKLDEHHAAQAAASPVLGDGLVNTGDGPMTRQEVLGRELQEFASAAVEGVPAAADAGSEVQSWL